MRSKLALVRAALLSAALVSSTTACVVDLFSAQAESRGSPRLAPLPPAAPVADNPVGIVDLGLDPGRDGTILVPASYDPTEPMPLLLLLHGAGGSANTILATHETLADSIGIIVLAVESRAMTWDAFFGVRFDYDIAFIDAALADVVARYNVDRSRIGVAGFSDGASYAMMLGLSNGDLFRAAIVHSPGVRFRFALHGDAPFYVAHGTDDTVLPVETTRRSFVPFLRAAGREVLYREWPGPHAMSVANIRESLRWFYRR